MSGVLLLWNPHGSLSWEKARDDASQFGVDWGLEWPIRGEDRGWNPGAQLRRVGRRGVGAMAIGTGVNYPHIRQVILFGQPDSLSLTASWDSLPAAEICSGYQSRTDCRNTEYSQHFFEFNQ